ncbi:hypothetical protein O9992_05320 [Vibrio lentus]|nr:hypothetical protein [Vibrio lentus]
MDNVTVSLVCLFVAVLFISQASGYCQLPGKKAKHKELSLVAGKETQRNIDEESFVSL